MAALTPELKRRWDTEGWCIVPAVVPETELAAAQDAMHRHFPTPAEMAEQGGSASSRTHGTRRWPEFPFHSSPLNALVLHDRVVDLAEGLLGTKDSCSGHRPRHSEVRDQASGYNQLLHADLAPHAGRAPSCARLSAGRVLRLPDRRHP